MVESGEVTNVEKKSGSSDLKPQSDNPISPLDLRPHTHQSPHIYHQSTSHILPSLCVPQRTQAAATHPHHGLKWLQNFKEKILVGGISEYASHLYQSCLRVPTGTPYRFPG